MAQVEPLSPQQKSSSGLKLRIGQRLRFSGTFVRLGTKPAYRGLVLPAILLKAITNLATGEVVSDQHWFNYTKTLKALGALTAGDVIEFNARVDNYQKGYPENQAEGCDQSSKTACQLTHLTKTVRVGRQSR